MRITVLGSGYVGLTQAAALAHVGHQVVCADIDKTRIESMQAGGPPFFEPGLDDLIKAGIKQNALRFSSDIENSVQRSDYIFICVGTPSTGDGSADMQYVKAAATSIAAGMTSRKVIINKSTSPVGTVDDISKWLSAGLEARGKNLPFEVCANPEFLKEGSAVADALRPDRIIIGVNSDAVCNELRQMYEAFNRNHEKIMFMDPRSAELTKYAANAMLATKISFMNEMANMAEALGADAEMIRRGIGADPRIGHHFIYPGAGYGGSCFPKDLRALISTASKHRIGAEILTAVEATNNAQKQKLFKLVTSRFGPDLSGRTIGLWGLSFKPNTSDMREAPSVTLIESALAAGATIRAFDPQAMEVCAGLFDNNTRIQYCPTKEVAIDGADCLVICTEWRNFWSPDFYEMKELLKTPVILDGRNLYDPTYMQQLGIEYFGIGRGLSA
tara:strand:+ start:269 stop:1600 length:1332 start_codon:yes stop_codon:yes gene_type:complete